MSRTLARLNTEGGISLETAQRKRASSQVEGRNSCFFSSCEIILGVPLQLMPGARSSSGAEAATSVFLSRTEMDLGVPKEFQ